MRFYNARTNTGYIIILWKPYSREKSRLREWRIYGQTNLSVVYAGEKLACGNHPDNTDHQSVCYDRIIFQTTVLPGHAEVRSGLKIWSDRRGDQRKLRYADLVQHPV